MLVEQIAGQTWTWVGTPNPSEKILAIFVKTEMITPINQPHREILAIGTQKYALPTTLGQLDPHFGLSSLHIPVVQGTPSIDQWYFIGEEIGNPTSTFYFFPPKTAIQLAIPYDQKEDFKAYPWHDILEAIDFFPDTGFPHSTNGPNGELLVADRLQPQQVFIPGGDIGTRQVTEKFLSALKFKISRHRVPVPNSILIAYHDVTAEFGSCLHPKIKSKPLRSAFAKFSAISGSAATTGHSRGQEFPATNVTTWVKHYPLDGQERILPHGLWERNRLTVYPPPKPGANTR